jgi:hypothetical protein
VELQGRCFVIAIQGEQVASNLRLPGKTAGEVLWNAAVVMLESIVGAHHRQGITVISSPYRDGLDAAIEEVADLLLADRDSAGPPPKPSGPEDDQNSRE